MNAVPRVFRHHLARLVAVALIVALYCTTRLPTLSDAERDTLVNHFHFTRFTLPGVSGHASRSIRTVNPSFQRIAGWISSVGAAVALNDLDGNALPDDVCSVDTRTDQVIVAPVPGTPARYTPFVLDAAPLQYDPATMAPMGCLPGDLNEDGLMDIVVYYWGRTPVAFLRQQESSFGNQPLTSADFVQQEIVPGEERWFTNAATMADLDGDGHVDLLVGNYFPDGARVLDAHARDQETMQDSMSRAYNGGRKHFLLWSGAAVGASPAVRFQEAASGLDEQISRSWTLALGAADLDGDLLPELYIANDFGPDRLLHNESRPGRLHFTLLQGQKTITSPGSKVLGHDSFKGMGVDFGDLNGDGLLDIFVSNITTAFALEESNFVLLSTGKRISPATGVAPYVDKSEPLGLSRSGWGWDAKLADFNNDGVPEMLQATGFVQGEINRWPELHELAMGNDALLHNPSNWLAVQLGDDLAGHEPNPFFVRAADGRYYDLSQDLGLDAPDVSRGIATADVDGDGKLDFAVANQWEPAVFYHNESRDTGASLELRLMLPLATGTSTGTQIWPGHAADVRGRPAIGASATVYLPDGQRLIAQVDGGNGHSGKRSSDLHFGLGQVSQELPLRVDLSWRASGGTVRHEQLELSPGSYTVVLRS
jgi:enediyne biosynthesis protein E4